MTPETGPDGIMATNKKANDKTTPTMGEVYERIVREAMERLRWSRKKAETMAAKLVKQRGKKFGVVGLTQKLDAIHPPQETREPTKKNKKRVPGKAKLPKNQKAPEKPLTKAQIAKLPPAEPPRPAPRTQLERLERRLGPDDGKRKRGGSPFVQGGSPGLGRRH